MADGVEDSIRRTVHFSGRVQGVGFRYTTASIAFGFQVAGSVRNLGDGRVELVAEGAPEELDRFQRAVMQRMESYVDEVRASDAAATGEFAAFSIAH